MATLSASLMTICPLVSMGGLSRSCSVQRNGALGLPRTAAVDL
jgi:hypothetical protein